LPADSNRFRAWWWLLLALLLAMRVPSLAQPAGADQALYAYVGQRILAGEVPYRDAWDQKPPAVHYAYALMQALWPNHGVVAAADLVLTAGTAVCLAVIASRLVGTSAAGFLTASLYLLFANPAFTRLGGVRIRAQCETFIGLCVALAVLAISRRLASRGEVSVRAAALGGLCVGLAATFKYNAVVYAIPLAVAIGIAVWNTPGPWAVRFRRAIGPLLAVAGGVVVPLAVMVAGFWAAGAVEDLYLATITYNVRYSGETYASRWHMLQYLLTFPIGHARLDALWLLGGAGSAMLLAASWWQPRAAVPVAWVAAACLAIAINGSRGLPQYFVQAWPPLALAAGVAGAIAWAALRTRGRVVLAVVLVLAVPRVTQFQKMLETTAADARRIVGDMDEETYLGRFGRVDSGDKYAALAVHHLARHLETTTRPDEPVYVFGFSPWAYVASSRESASRFFWSRPVIIGFEAGRAGYGVAGLLDELHARPPAVVVLQDRDWDPDGPNSLEFFLGEPRLAEWLNRSYQPAGTLHNFHLWTRTGQR
jgi:4-amino-4-deoxy-L-arabinose transferase-like glycosyltransferase